MGMHLKRKGGTGFQSLDQLLCLVGDQQAGHILDADGIRAHALDLSGDVHPVLIGISVAQCVGKGDLSVAAIFLAGLYGGLQVAQVVQAVKDTDDVDAVGDGLLYEVLYYIICVVAVAKQVLAAEQHLQLGVLEAFSEDSQPLPGIFLQETQAGVKSSSAPALDRVVSDTIQLINDGEHLFCGHSGGDQGLMRVTQNSIRDFNGFRHSNLLIWTGAHGEGAPFFFLLLTAWASAGRLRILMEQV